ARGGSLVPVGHRIVENVRGGGGPRGVGGGGLAAVGERRGIGGDAARGGGGGARPGGGRRLGDRGRQGGARVGGPGRAVAAERGRRQGAGQDLVARVRVLDRDRVGDGHAALGRHVPGPAQVGAAERRGAGRGRDVAVVAGVVQHAGQRVGERGPQERDQ